MSANQRPTNNAKNRVRFPAFKLECPGTVNDYKRVREKIRLIKDAYPNSKMTNTDIIELALSSLLFMRIASMWQELETIFYVTNNCCMKDRLISSKITYQ